MVSKSRIQSKSVQLMFYTSCIYAAPTRTSSQGAQRSRQPQEHRNIHGSPAAAIAARLDCFPGRGRGCGSVCAFALEQSSSMMHSRDVICVHWISFAENHGRRNQVAVPHSLIGAVTSRVKFQASQGPCIARSAHMWDNRTTVEQQSSRPPRLRSSSTHGIPSAHNTHASRTSPRLLLVMGIPDWQHEPAVGCARNDH
ncbi:hypothetical protein IE81DRAFT_160004 [Ceraceosorus guamensis]|uniref:Uncharacterized protein n=1 Tax=Ceraceosorus guamensis TaxID=1522189 RepID=A0A316VXP5_9BASI|nr:hypothetical protein IE81DRAFT_160004 [Ceraceosorus guamensis]PWN41668.1 hypothetical protein IE81DRAFT_160004 [Ceraceosorus guamensis]